MTFTEGLTLLLAVAGIAGTAYAHAMLGSSRRAVALLLERLDELSNVMGFHAGRVRDLERTVFGSAITDGGWTSDEEASEGTVRTLNSVTGRLARLEVAVHRKSYLESHAERLDALEARTLSLELDRATPDPEPEPTPTTLDRLWRLVSPEPRGRRARPATTSIPLPALEASAELLPLYSETGDSDDPFRDDLPEMAPRRIAALVGTLLSQGLTLPDVSEALGLSLGHLEERVAEESRIMVPGEHPSMIYAALRICALNIGTERARRIREGGARVGLNAALADADAQQWHEERTGVVGVVPVNDSEANLHRAIGTAELAEGETGTGGRTIAEYLETQQP